MTDVQGPPPGSDGFPGALPEQPGRSPRVDGLHGLPPTPRRLALRRLAAAGRDIIDVMSSTSADEDELAQAAALLENVAATIRRMPGGAHYEGIAEMANAGELLASRRDLIDRGDPEAWASFDFSPFIGLANPMSPPMELAYDGAKVVCNVRFGSAYEGPPGCVHGGYVAAAFDEVLGAAQSLSGTQGMTAADRQLPVADPALRRPADRGRTRPARGPKDLRGRRHVRRRAAHRRGRGAVHRVRPGQVRRAARGSGPPGARLRHAADALTRTTRRRPTEAVRARSAAP
ncbi:MAG: hypothetical protein V9E99_18585 [Microthrixaceae bacterium]